jgi:uncharacterized protein (TIGR03118 family)
MPSSSVREIPEAVKLFAQELRSNGSIFEIDVQPLARRYDPAPSYTSQRVRQRHALSIGLGALLGNLGPYHRYGGKRSVAMKPIRLSARLVSLAIGALMFSACGGESLVSTGSNPTSTPPPTATATPTSTPTVTPTVSTAGYQQTNLVADVEGTAEATDSNLVNPWGLAAGPTTFWWVANNHTGTSTLYNGDGQKELSTVTVPGAPTGVVFNGGSGFVVSDGAGHSGPARFIFAGEDGGISGWNPDVPAGPFSTQAFVAVDNSASGAIYKGLALGSNADGDFLFATDFHNAKVDVFDDTFQPATLAGNFTDPDIPAGFAPFGIHTIGNNLYVTYAMQDEDAEDDVPGAGNGFVDVFDTDGNLVRRFATQGTLNSPWGVALAPADFGQFSNAVLVGNFGDGRIMAFAADSGDSLGQLADTAGTTIAIDGLWALAFGNGGNAGATNTLFFTAGTDDEAHGLFGSLQATSNNSMP